MTYRELLSVLQIMTDAELDTDLTVYSTDDNEYYPIYGINFTTVTDILDEGHPYFWSNFSVLN